MSSELDTAAAIREMQDAALSRAIADEGRARQSLAVAGALEPARATTADGPGGDRTLDDGGVTLAASLAFVSTLFAHGRLTDSLRSAVSATDDSAWHPSGRPARVDDELVARGATLAAERFDVPVSRLAVLGDVSVERIVAQQ